VSEGSQDIESKTNEGAEDESKNIDDKSSASNKNGIYVLLYRYLKAIRCTTGIYWSSRRFGVNIQNNTTLYPR
jgi:hypothetical protein